LAGRDVAQIVAPKRNYRSVGADWRMRAPGSGGRPGSEGVWREVRREGYEAG
jgi:hypothetical protein